MSDIDAHIQRLNSDAAPGLDGITPKHLINGNCPVLLLYLSNLLSTCITYCVLPNSFRHGLILPILKKSGLNPADPGSYRPITISCVLSKLLELHVLQESSFQGSDAQFGFLPNRGTAQAISLVHDVAETVSQSGSTPFFCSLDAASAFDGIPHETLFLKSMPYLPKPLWAILYEWYRDFDIRVRDDTMCGSPIPIKRGTKQGGLTSPLLFNAVYKELVDQLNNTAGGIKLGHHSYSVFCYADDILLASLTASGLQNLLNSASDLIEEIGLRFNPSKSSCMIYGRCPFRSTPNWTMGGVTLSVGDSLTYLGATLCNDGGRAHRQARFKAASKSFFSLSGAGLGNPMTNPRVSAQLLRTSVDPVLWYGCDAIGLTAGELRELDKNQGKLYKNAFNLPQYCRNSPLLQALDVPPVSYSVNKQSLNLYKSSLLNSPYHRRFYHYCLVNKNICKNTLLFKCHNLLQMCNCSLSVYPLVQAQGHKALTKLHSVSIRHAPAGLVDSLKTVLNCSPFNSTCRTMLKNLLSPF